MSSDPFKASIQYLIIVALVISAIAYVVIGHDAGDASEAVVGALIYGVTITGHLAVLAVALWVLSSFFK